MRMGLIHVFISHQGAIWHGVHAFRYLRHADLAREFLHAVSGFQQAGGNMKLLGSDDRAWLMWALPRSRPIGIELQLALGNTNHVRATAP